MGAQIVHVEIPSTDLKKSKLFYESVFGWEVSLESGMEGYALFRAGDGPGGGFDATGKKKADGEIVLYIQVEDINATLEKIKKGEGKVAAEKRDIGGGNGWFALFRDPCDNLLGLWSQN